MARPRFDTFREFDENTRDMTPSQGYALAEEEHSILRQWIMSYEGQRKRRPSTDSPAWDSYHYDLKMFLCHIENGISSADERKKKQFEDIEARWERNAKQGSSGNV